MTRRTDLACRELVDLVTDYLEGALSPADTLRFERHLRDCDGCQAYVDQYRRTIDLLGLLGRLGAASG